MYDERCYELASWFLPSGGQQEIAALAQEIQDTIETFCEAARPPEATS